MTGVLSRVPSHALPAAAPNADLRARGGLFAARALAVALAAGSLAVIAPGCGRAAPPAPQVGPANDNTPVRVTTAAAQPRTRAATLQLTGTLVPDRQASVTPLVAGRVMEVLVERGSVVREGQPMMRLRDVDFRSSAENAAAAVDQARARLGLDASGHFDPENTAESRAARANMELADDALRRLQQLSQSGSVSEQDLLRAQQSATAAREQYRAAVNGARAAYFGYRSAQTAVAQTRRAVEDSIVRAPFDGEIAERAAQVGEYVSPQRGVVTLVRTNPLRIELQIPQERIAHVQRGQSVELRIDAFPDRTFTGTVQYISAAVRSDTRSLIAEAVVPNADGTLRPGLFATARLQLPQQERVVVVPADAVISEAGSHRVYVIANGVAQERVVTLAERNAREALISRGVEPNELVAHGEIARLSDGARVQ